MNPPGSAGRYTTSVSATSSRAKSQSRFLEPRGSSPGPLAGGRSPDFSAADRRRGVGPWKSFIPSVPHAGSGAVRAGGRLNHSRSKGAHEVFLCGFSKGLSSLFKRKPFAGRGRTIHFGARVLAELAMGTLVSGAMSILEELDWRGLVADCTDRVELAKRTAAGPVTLYCGFDPTADSLHVGHLWAARAAPLPVAGHHPDPAGRRRDRPDRRSQRQDQERQLLTRKQIDAQRRLRQAPALAACSISTRKTNPARLVDNAAWTAPVTLPRFPARHRKAFFRQLRWWPRKASARAWKTAKWASATPNSATCCCRPSISIICAETINCELQIGGSDQWGNITAGIDLIRKKLGRDRLWPDAAAHHQGRRHQVRQDRRRRGLARSAEDQRLPLLPVLDQAPTTAM